MKRRVPSIKLQRMNPDGTPQLDQHGNPMFVTKSKDMVDKMFVFKSIEKKFKVVSGPASRPAPTPTPAPQNNGPGNTETPIKPMAEYKAMHHSSRKKYVGEVNDVSYLSALLGQETANSVKAAIEARIKELND